MASHPINQIRIGSKISSKIKLPVTRSNPDESCLRKTTLFPMNLPANNINTVPGVILDLIHYQNKNQQ
jgi:hypothetical protein